MANKLSIYNEALSLLGQRRLASLRDEREERRALDDVWDSILGYCIEQGMWKFMIRAVQAAASNSLVPAFGFSYAFQIPNDWVRTVRISTSETLEPPLLQLREEAGLWYANSTPLFISYVSDNNAYGQNLGEWPETFAYYVAVRLASQAAFRVTGDLKIAAYLEGKEKKARIDARAKDAMNEPPGFPPVSSWVRARRGLMTRMPGSGDGGNTSSLIG